jgi:hypothetical protein
VDREKTTGVSVAKIMILCPSRSQPIATGLSTDSVIFASLPNVAVGLKCPLCGKHHTWRPRQAWLEESADAGPGSIIIDPAGHGQRNAQAVRLVPISR